MTQRTLQLSTPRGGYSLAPRPATSTGPASSDAPRQPSRFLAAARYVLGQLRGFFVSPRGDLLWRADELPDAVLKDVDPQLHEARAGRYTGWFGSDTRHLPPF